jgi:hypothetical protein
VVYGFCSLPHSWSHQSHHQEHHHHHHIHHHHPDPCVPLTADRVTTGIRTLRFDAAKGFFLNEEPVKIQGMCNHQVRHRHHHHQQHHHPRLHPHPQSHPHPHPHAKPASPSSPPLPPPPITTPTLTLLLIIIIITTTPSCQDFAGTGVAVPDSLQGFRVARLKEMGANAWRTAHNPPTPALLDW